MHTVTLQPSGLQFQVEDGEAVLRPANPAYPVLRPGERLDIFGVVVGLIRNYRR